MHDQVMPTHSGVDSLCPAVHMAVAVLQLIIGIFLGTQDCHFSASGHWSIFVYFISRRPRTLYCALHSTVLNETATQKKCAEYNRSFYVPEGKSSCCIKSAVKSSRTFG